MPRKHATRSASNKPLRDRVATVLETLRPMVQTDGGDIELVSVEEGGVVRVRLLGACIGCPSSEMTLIMGIERTLRRQIPEVTAVVGT